MNMPVESKALLEAELAAVERQWRSDQERYLVRGPDGELVERAPVNVGRCIVLMVGSVIGMALISALPLPVYLPLLGLIPFGVGTFRLMIGSSKAEAFERCRTEYLTRRDSLMRKLSEAAREP
jgi:hypothetical protein